MIEQIIAINPSLSGKTRAVLKFWWQIEYSYKPFAGKCCHIPLTVPEPLQEACGFLQPCEFSSKAEARGLVLQNGTVLFSISNPFRLYYYRDLSDTNIPEIIDMKQYIDPIRLPTESRHPDKPVIYLSFPWLLSRLTRPLPGSFYLGSHQLIAIPCSSLMSRDLTPEEMAKPLEYYGISEILELTDDDSRSGEYHKVLIMLYRALSCIMKSHNMKVQFSARKVPDGALANAATLQHFLEKTMSSLTPLDRILVVLPHSAIEIMKKYGNTLTEVWKNFMAKPEHYFVASYSIPCKAATDISISFPVKMERHPSLYEQLSDDLKARLDEERVLRCTFSKDFKYLYRFGIGESYSPPAPFFRACSWFEPFKYIRPENKLVNFRNGGVWQPDQGWYLRDEHDNVGIDLIDTVRKLRQEASKVCKGMRN